MKTIKVKSARQISSAQTGHREREADILKRNYLVEGFPERLKQAIEDSGLSHVDILRRTGISKATLYSYLNGSKSPQGLHIARLATCLHVSSDFLLGISK